jgi:hypothetical protein
VSVFMAAPGVFQSWRFSFERSIDFFGKIGLRYSECPIYAAANEATAPSLAERRITSDWICTDGQDVNTRAECKLFARRYVGRDEGHGIAIVDIVRIKIDLTRRGTWKL